MALDLLQYKILIMAVSAGSALAAILITWFKFLPYWEENRLGHGWGLAGCITILHQAFFVTGPLPVAVYAGSYMGKESVLNEWVVFSVMGVSFGVLILINRLLKE